MYEIIAKLLISTGIGFLIGRERKKNDKSGGSRTMALVCLASTLIAILSLKMLNIEGNIDIMRTDVTRLFAYTISSIGFLGMGMIIQVKGQVEGLTTASTLFALVPTGFCIGLGYYFVGIITAILIYLILDFKYWGILNGN